MSSLYKSQARRLRERLLSLGVNLSHSHALEAVAAFHNAPSWNVLCAAEPDEAPLDDELEFAIARLYEDDIEPEHIVAIDVVDGYAYAAVQRDDRSVEAIVVPLTPHRPVSEMEGPYACEAPREVLDALTPTEDKHSLLWRRACWVQVLREEWLRRRLEGEMTTACPWVPLIRPQQSGPYFDVLVRLNDRDNRFALLTTKGPKIVEISVDEQQRLDEMPPSSQVWADRAYVQVQLGQSSPIVYAVGDEGFEVVVCLSESGGLVAWTANPQFIQPANEYSLTNLPIAFFP